ncbi:MAG: hypothetical protein H7A08_05170 [Oceanospirillaceae bacterium]|nr:hypothetical protein [Oceanospirillaceae bacterium]MCP5350112.1 hypothetical protein [Oceanospirillaceae bacterium]
MIKTQLKKPPTIRYNRNIPTLKCVFWVSPSLVLALLAANNTAANNASQKNGNTRGKSPKFDAMAGIAIKQAAKNAAKRAMLKVHNYSASTVTIDWC